MTTPGEARSRLLQEIGRGKSFEEIAQQIVNACAEVLDSSICTLWRVYVEGSGERHLRLMAAYGVVAPQTLAQEVTYQIRPAGPTFDGVTGRVASRLETVRVNSFAELIARFKPDHEGRMDRIQWSNRPEINFRNLLAVPIHLDRDVLGVLKVENRIGRDFEMADEALLHGLLEPVAVICKSMLLLDELEHRHIDAPNRFTEVLVRPHDPDQLTQDIVQTTAETLDAEICSLWGIDIEPTGRYLTLKASLGIKSSAKEPRYLVPDKPDDVTDKDLQGMTAWVAARRKAFWANSHEELKKHPSWKGQTDEVTWGSKGQAQTSFRSLYAVPLVWRDEILGVLKVENPKGKHHFTATDHQKCQLLANLVVLVLVISRQMRVSLLPEMAHILKSPVAGIVANLRQIQEELNQEVPDYSNSRKFLEFAKKATMTVDVISRTLAAEMLRSVQEQARERVDLTQVLSDWTAYAQQMVPDGVSVTLRQRTRPPVILITSTEKTWIEIVIFNLLHNAAKYSPVGGTVSVSTDRSKRGYRIVVEDRGRGFDNANITRVFEPGFKTKAPGWPEGTGLGLFTVRDRLHRLGWECRVENRKPTGARVVITIPVKWRQRES
jgi:GAF domain-containing protein/anti-sigma regulatory factor (Ser/Thr protein kinase)